MKRFKRHKVKEEMPQTSTSHTTQEHHDLAYYIHDRVELMHQVFSSLKYREIKAMVPACIRNISLDDLQELCTEELLGISSKRLCAILDGADPPTDTESSSASEPLETISLDSISSDDEVLSQCSKQKKHKHRHSKSKTKHKRSKAKHTDKQDIPTDAQADNQSKATRAGLTVLELLELQARARAIRAQLQQEQKNKPQSESAPPEATNSSDGEVEIKEEPAEVVEISSEDEKPKIEELEKEKPTEKEPEPQPKSVTKRINNLVITVPKKTTQKIKLNRNKTGLPTPEKTISTPTTEVKTTKATKTPEKLKEAVKDKDKKVKKKKGEKKRVSRESDNDEITLQLSDTEKMDLLEDLDRKNLDNVSSDSQSSSESESSENDSDQYKTCMRSESPKITNTTIKNSDSTDNFDKIESNIEKIDDNLTKNTNMTSKNVDIDKINDTLTKSAKSIPKSTDKAPKSPQNYPQPIENESINVEKTSDLEKVLEDSTKSPPTQAKAVNSPETGLQLAEKLVKSPEKCLEVTEKDAKSPENIVQSPKNKSIEENTKLSNTNIESSIINETKTVSNQNSNSENTDLQNTVPKNIKSVDFTNSQQNVINFNTDDNKSSSEIENEKQSEKEMSEGELSDRESSEIEAVDLKPEVVCISDEEASSKGKKKKKKKDKKSKKEKKSKKKSDFRESADQNFYKERLVTTIDKSRVDTHKKLSITINNAATPAKDNPKDNPPIDIDETDLRHSLIAKKVIKTPDSDKNFKLTVDNGPNNTTDDTKITDNKDITTIDLDTTDKKQTTDTESSIDDVYEVLELSDDSSCYEVEGILSKEPTTLEIEALSAKIDEIERIEVITEEEIKEYEKEQNNVIENQKEELKTNENSEEIENISWKDRYLDSKKVKQVLNTSNILNALRKKNKELKKKLEETKIAEIEEVVNQEEKKDELSEEGTIEQYNTLESSTKYVDPVKEDQIYGSLKKDAKLLLKMYKKLLKYNDINRQKDPNKKKKKKKKERKKSVDKIQKED